MPGRKLLAGISVLVALALAATGLLLYSRPRRSGGGVPPYYKRTGFLSKLLLDLNTGGPKGLTSIHVPDGFGVEVAAGPGLVTYPMFIAFDDRGRLFVCESAGRNISDQEMDRQAEMRIRLL